MYINYDRTVYNVLGKTKEERTTENFVTIAAKNSRFSRYSDIVSDEHRATFIEKWTKQVQTLIDIIESYGYKWDFFCEGVFSGNYGIMYYVGDTVIESETGGKMPIYDIYVALPLSFGDSELEKIGIRHVYFSRTSFTRAEFFHQYIHSHVCSSKFSTRRPEDNYGCVDLDYDEAIHYNRPEFGEVCLGDDTEISTNMNSLCMAHYEDLALQFELLINQINSFLSWESISGVPYVELKPVIRSYLSQELDIEVDSFNIGKVIDKIIESSGFFKKDDLLITDEYIKLKYDDALYKKISDFVDNLNVYANEGTELVDDGNVTRTQVFGYEYHKYSMEEEDYEELGEPVEEPIFTFIFQGEYVPLVEIKNLGTIKSKYILRVSDFDEIYERLNNDIEDEYLQYKINLVKV